MKLGPEFERQLTRELGWKPGAPGAARVVEFVETWLAERVWLVLPCEHLVERPTDTGAVIACRCGRTWNVRPDAGGRSFACQELS